jgi:NADH:ubiquinone oxidoreductase subunit
MIEIEKYPCNDVNEAKKKEREWFENLNSKLNTYSPQGSLTNQEYRIVNKDILTIKEKEWRILHKDEIAIRDKIYNIANKDEIAIYKKTYYIANKDESNKRSKEWRISHKEENSTRRSKRIICECGIEINIDHKSRHLKTKVNDNMKPII